MLRLQQQKVLEECKWTPGEGQLRYIEALIFPDRKNATPDNYQEGDLSDEDVIAWLRQTDRFVRPTDSRLGKEEGSIRLLICERFGFHPLEFGLSKKSWEAIVEELGEPTEMLPFFKFNGGGHSYCFRPSAPDQTPEQLVITIKVPQMYQIANYGLCLTHSFKTHVTLGFMFGWNMINDENWKRCMNTERPRHLEPHGPRISDLIQKEVPNWRHPLLLPVILLEDHVYNADRYKGFDLSPRATNLEKQLGVTKAGRNVGSLKPLDFGARSQNMTVEKRFEIITDINTTVTEVVTFTGNLRWDNRYCQFLRDISKDIREFKSTQGGEPKLENTIETLATLVVSILEHAEAIKARLDIQLDVLYNLVAQVDSNVNSTIAATTGLDSVAMKALAFVTTIFLPPTFIATLFSMSMFDWQADGKAQSPNPNEGSKVVSRHFWIYWMISVPLTIVVLLTWRTWWHREKNHYRQKYPHVKLDNIVPDMGSNVFNRRIKKMWERKKTEDIELN
ncbi:hypothetical protein K458DRAFT_377367 [Lentithecium fluviatile CBS 122367]|uniref:Cora-domain-containing protein n=1 Tax=Lentithecium fluviatile CBS 122367 TaxID=1168545 RepID=A0A6G1IJB1_9PLEO|nr:hypothetical protein K458DRAFT_377367 [Lentithecium fluviatile CBS 122367]